MGRASEQPLPASTHVVAACPRTPWPDAQKMECRLELSTFLLPHYFLPLGSLANALKGLAWMAGGSSRSAFNVAFACEGASSQAAALSRPSGAGDNC